MKIKDCVICGEVIDEQNPASKFRREAHKGMCMILMNHTYIYKGKYVISDDVIKKCRAIAKKYDVGA